MKAMPLVIPTPKLCHCEYPVSLRNKSDNLNTVSYWLLNTKTFIINNSFNQIIKINKINRIKYHKKYSCTSRAGSPGPVMSSSQLTHIILRFGLHGFTHQGAIHVYRVATANRWWEIRPIWDNVWVIWDILILQI